MGVQKLPTLGLPQLWHFITLCLDLRLRWSLNQSCSCHQELSNGMSHATCTQGNLVDSRVLMVESQIGNLTLDLSFGHNLCFRCPNGSCEPILNICIPIALLKAMGFDPCNCALKIRESTGILTPKVGVPLGVWRSIPSHSLAFSGFSFGPQPCNPLALVVSPRLGLRQ
jgi:hypothetical protein